MSRSKTASIKNATIHKAQREAAVIAAAHAAPIIRNAIDRTSADVRITADTPENAATAEINSQLLNHSDAFAASLPSWLFAVCPDWYIVALPVKDEQTGRTTGHETKRDVESWDKARVKAFEAIRRMEFESRTRADGSLERYVPEPCNMARLLSFVIAGNMQATIEAAPAVVAESRVSKTRAAGFSYYNAGAAQVLDARAYSIILASAALSQRQRQYEKASDTYLRELSKDNDRNTKNLKRRDNAESALLEAERQFDAAWRERHLLPADVIALMSPLADDAQAGTEAPIAEDVTA